MYLDGKFKLFPVYMYMYMYIQLGWDLRREKSRGISETPSQRQDLTTNLTHL